NRDYDRFTKRSVDLWIDPKTSLPVRVEETSSRREPNEVQMKALEGKKTKNGVIKLSPEEMQQQMEKWPEIITVRIMTDIKFNVPVDESTFSLTPPPGYELTETKVPG